MTYIKKIILFGLMSLMTEVSLAAENSLLSRLNPKNAKIFLQVGAFNVYQGRSQNIGIDGLIGDRFTVDHQHSNNVLLGLGYYVDGLDEKKFNLLYGLNAFYFAHTFVRGKIIQEQLFTNLSYSYSVTQYPIYLATKALIKNNSNKYNVTLDFGVGPNIIHTGNVNEYSLDGGVTQPDRAFSGKTTVSFSAMLGVGMQFNNVLGHLPVELGYRFFYFGHGQFNKLSDQLMNTLDTGNNYANALVLSIAV